MTKIIKIEDCKECPLMGCQMSLVVPTVYYCTATTRDDCDVSEFCEAGDIADWCPLDDDP